MIRPRSRWQLWEWGPGPVAWVFVAEPVVVMWLATVCVQTHLSGLDLLRFAVVLGCGLAHVVVTSAHEEKRRATHGGGTHVDHTSIWILPAAAMLPMPLTVVLIGVLRGHRYLIARKPMHKWMHTNLAICLSALGVHWVATITPLREWLLGTQPLPGLPAADAAVSLAAALATYFVAQAVMVGAVRTLHCLFPYRGVQPRSSDETVLVYALGTWKDNGEIVYALLLAGATTVVMSFSFPLAVLMVPVAACNQILVQQREESTTDHQTKALTKRGFLMPATRLLDRAQSTRMPVSLMMLDIDYFKRINDRLGHLVGDIVLTAVAGAIRSSLRGSDLLGRWGGEEFVVLLPNTNNVEALALAERIRRAVEHLQIPITKPRGGEPVILGMGAVNGVDGCTLSIGVALAPVHGETLLELAQKADEALYRAKDAGRNRVVSAATDGDLPSQQRQSAGTLRKDRRHRPPRTIRLTS